MNNFLYVTVHIGYMGSIYYVERNGQKYAYESVSRRVPGKKNPVTKKTYLGKVDPDTGKIIPKESKKVPSEEHVRKYGCVKVLDKVQSDLGIMDDLCECFPDIAENIMATAMAVAIDPTPFDDIHFTVDENGLKDWLKLRGNLSPTVLSDMTKDLGQRLSAMDMFFTHRVSRMDDNDSYSMDITSNSTHSDMGGYAEWGYNRDGEDLPQTEILLDTDSKGIPIAFQMLPGSISDSSTLDGTVEWMTALGIKGRLVADRGFENARNISSLLDRGIRFTIPSNAREMPIKKLMTKAIPLMKDSDSIRRHEGRTYRVVEFEVGVADLEDGARYVTKLNPNEKNAESENTLFEASRRIRAFVVLDPRKAADDMDTLMSAIEDAELRLEGTKRKNPDKEFEKLPAFVRSHLEWSVDDEGIMHVSRLQNSFSFDSNRAGMFVMFTSEGTDWEEMMSSYDTRDWVEKAFDVYKTDVDGSRSRTGDPDRARARFFIKMLALIMRIHIQNTLRDHEQEILSTKAKKDNVCGLTVSGMMRTLGTLMVIVSPGYTRLTPPSKTVREIFSLFGLEEPVAGKITLS
jgi:transposase